jgi:hypothetical protein
MFLNLLADNTVILTTTSAITTSLKEHQQTRTVFHTFITTHRISNLKRLCITVVHLNMAMPAPDPTNLNSMVVISLQRTMPARLTSRYKEWYLASL